MTTCPAFAASVRLRVAGIFGSKWGCPSQHLPSTQGTSRVRLVTERRSGAVAEAHEH